MKLFLDETMIPDTGDVSNADLIDVFYSHAELLRRIAKRSFDIFDQESTQRLLTRMKLLQNILEEEYGYPAIGTREMERDHIAALAEFALLVEEFAFARLNSRLSKSLDELRRARDEEFA